jgi:ABC-2 type transport system permease protein
VALFGALFFNGSLDAYRFLTLRAMQFQNPAVLEHLNVTERVVSPLFGSTGLLVIFVAPFFTMRLFAEEKRTRTFELLLTAPVRPIQIVLGKYLSALALFSLALLLVALYPLLLSFYAGGLQGGGGVEWQTVGTGLLGILLFGAMALSLGMFVSVLTESVIVAGVVSFLLLLLYVATIFTIGVEGPVRELTGALSAAEHLGSFLSGRLELKDLTYFLSFVVLGLFLTDRAVEAHRWG